MQRGGRIYLFRSGIPTQIEAMRTVFHELFHYGLSKQLSQAEYVQTMLRLGNDPLVQQYAAHWKKSADGVKKKGTMPVNNWHAMAIEEALSDIAEDLHVNNGRVGTA